MAVVPLLRFILLMLPALLSGCASTPEVKQSAPAAANGQVVPYALSLQGVPYVWGGASPERGFDCSGFVQHVYQRHGIDLPRTAREMASKLPEVPKNCRLPGDLLFFRTDGRSYSHVGIYIGNESFVHASSSHSGVKVSSLSKPYWLSRFLGVRRPDSRYRRSDDTVAAAHHSHRTQRRGHP
ncbi:C40 family peptidase [Methylococcus geothermalis]|uniref:NlpC/P60 family protein n=1 Tax=Methylococcus geothermalis TaxID=2681310 RepID=A0A858Q460_9GAMM|nr:C40 family peptidase [Methylococcus geothermalis]QJD28603.1 NlpC/P60 family protein [Methylococcus geothermalis]